MNVLGASACSRFLPTWFRKKKKTRGHLQSFLFLQVFQVFFVVHAACFLARLDASSFLTLHVPDTPWDCHICRSIGVVDWGSVWGGSPVPNSRRVRVFFPKTPPSKHRPRRDTSQTSTSVWVSTGRFPGRLAELAPNEVHHRFSRTVRDLGRL